MEKITCIYANMVLYKELQLGYWVSSKHSSIGPSTAAPPQRPLHSGPSTALDQHYPLLIGPSTAAPPQRPLHSGPSTAAPPQRYGPTLSSPHRPLHSAMDQHYPLLIGPSTALDQHYPLLIGPSTAAPPQRWTNTILSVYQTEPKPLEPDKAISAHQDCGPDEEPNQHQHRWDHLQDG
ncbi:hypothetical protein NHX12_006673 [Muraenolepis orangiensis]|uniref:Uncharacterized protein n=1 Tax=Muraenolepis orangiensis TaxID=630683 RepID=A0A9Q0DMR4_9TELE|nr:hypothetical protein NHX12_006673 [Muraenolepis orangiensis]